MTDEIKIGDWHHGPLHLFVPNTLYMVTASTLTKQHIFDSPAKLQLLQNTLFEVMRIDSGSRNQPLVLVDDLVRVIEVILDVLPEHERQQPVMRIDYGKHGAVPVDQQRVRSLQVGHIHADV